MTYPNLSPDQPITVENLLKLSNTIDLFEQYARPHASQMARLAEALALRVGISGMDLNALKIAALLHDIGEMIMDSPALRKGGQIDFKNKIELWRHPIIGEQQLAKRELPKQAQLLVRWHHEKWNGAGYPDMLYGERIPIGARILRLVDTYDALTAHRPHREAFSLVEAQEIIEKLAGIEFDPYLTKVFLELLYENSSPQPSSFKPSNDSLETSTHSELEKLTNIEKTIEPNIRLECNASSPPLENDLIPADENIQPIEKQSHTLANVEATNSESVPLFDTSVPSPINLSESIPTIGTLETESKNSLETQPLFLPSNELTRELLNTSYLSTSNQLQPDQSEEKEKTKEVLLNDIESIDQENVENKK